MLLNFCLWDVPVRRTEDTACSQEKAASSASGGEIWGGLLALIGNLRLLATQKDISLPLSKNILEPEELDETGVACSPPTKQERNHLARCTSQRSAAKPDALASSELQYQHLAQKNWAIWISKALLQAVFLSNGGRQRRVYLYVESNSTVPVFHIPVLSKRRMCSSRACERTGPWM